MPSKIKSGLAAHDAACALAYGVCQSAIAAAAGSQSAVLSAEVTYYRAVLASALANGSSEASYFSQTLRALGTGGV
jgi:hypothetical protein